MSYGSVGNFNSVRGFDAFVSGSSSFHDGVGFEAGVAAGITSPKSVCTVGVPGGAIRERSTESVTPS
ncbi:MAG: hypothetical protein K2K83_05400, partial [Rikenella sp.]|nr:hypothetical protein [Rikenella sp.]